MHYTSSMKFGFTLVFALLILVGQLLAAPLSSSTAFSNPNTDSNPIVQENRHPGSSEWQLPWFAAYTVADDVGMQIKGYTSNFAVKPGASIDLKVTVTPAQDFQVDVLRLGYYQGYGGRLMAHAGTFHGIQQQPCITVPITNMISCNWQTSARLLIERNWLSGLHSCLHQRDGIPVAGSVLGGGWPAFRPPISFFAQCVPSL